jgi:hypothetical protein
MFGLFGVLEAALPVDWERDVGAVFWSKRLRESINLVEHSKPNIEKTYPGAGGGVNSSLLSATFSRSAAEFFE